MDYVAILNNHLISRKQANSQYSLRAFARDLDLHPSALSLILKCKRDLPLEKVDTVVRGLKLKTAEKKLFIQSLYKKKPNQIKKFYEIPILVDSPISYKIISEWEYAAVFTLMDTKNFQSDTQWISQRLMITPSRAQHVIDNLIEVGIFYFNRLGRLEKKSFNLRTTDQLESKALQLAHKNELKNAIQKLAHIPIAHRDFVAHTFAISTKKLNKAKEITRNYILKMESLLEDKNADEVFQLNVQLYPVTQINSKQSKGD